MKLATFWELIENVKDSETAARDIQEILRVLPSEELVSFRWHFENLFLIAQRMSLFQAAYLLIGHCNEEIFNDFVSSLITKGKNTFEEALNDPDSIVKYCDDSNVTDDVVRYLPEWIYKENFDQRLPDSFWNAPGKYPASEIREFPVDENWDFDNESENRKHLPKLSEIYYGNDRLNLHDHGITIITLVNHHVHTLKKTYVVSEVRKIPPAA